jgi:glycerol kinase
MRTCVIDTGTTSIRTVVYEDQKQLDFQSEPLTRFYPQPGFVELDPQEITFKVKKLLDLSIDKWDVDAIAITNQRTTSILWDAKTSKNLFPALTWQDVRARPVADSLNRLWLIRFGKIIGKLAIGVYKTLPSLRNSRRIRYMVTISKLSFKPNHASVHLMWMLQNLRNREKYDLKFGTIDTWILWNLCGEYATDYTNASATGIYDIFFKKWSENILKIIGFPPESLAEVKNSDSIFGEYKGIPIASIIADQQASLFAQDCFEFGDIKCTNGTGSFIDVNVGDAPTASLGGLIPMMAWKTGSDEKYMLEGYVSFSGSAMDWIREIGLLNRVEESSKLAFSSVDEKLLFVPSFAGLGTPHYIEVPGTLWGISNKTRKEDIVKSLLEALSFRIAEIIGIIRRELKITSESIRMDGKFSSNDFLLQRVADVTGLNVERSRFLEGSSFGAHLMAGVAMKEWEMGDLVFTPEKIFEPSKDLKEKFEKWSKLVDEVKRIGWPD